MLDKGYSYPDGVISLTEQYVPGMADKLDKILKDNEPTNQLVEGEEPPK